jgi:1,2-diacylglycerol-3-alpha-glucose alpha-1,2-galactosyltransferase
MHSIQIAFTSLGFCSIAAFIYLVVRKRNTITKAHLTSNGTIRLHMISETAWVSKGQGVHTAFLELIELLKNDSRLSISINGEGNGDVFHSHTYGPYYFWMGRKYKGRRILTAHVIPDSSIGAIPFWKQLLPLTTWYLKLAYAYADVVIAISPTVESKILE